mgnify:CR=1 FL=1
MMKYEKDIRDILSSIMKDINFETLSATQSLKSIGMNSITFIMVVLEIEKRFSIEVPAENLIMDDSDTIVALARIVEVMLT